MGTSSSKPKEQIQKIQTQPIVQIQNNDSDVFIKQIQKKNQEKFKQLKKVKEEQSQKQRTIQSQRNIQRNNKETKNKQKQSSNNNRQNQDVPLTIIQRKQPQTPKRVQNQKKTIKVFEDDDFLNEQRDFVYKRHTTKNIQKIELQPDIKEIKKNSKNTRDDFMMESITSDFNESPQHIFKKDKKFRPQRIN